MSARPWQKWLKRGRSLSCRHRDVKQSIGGAHMERAERSKFGLNTVPRKTWKFYGETVAKAMENLSLTIVEVSQMPRIGRESPYQSKYPPRFCAKHLLGSCSMLRRDALQPLNCQWQVTERLSICSRKIKGLIRQDSQAIDEKAWKQCCILKPGGRLSESLLEGQFFFK